MLVLITVALDRIVRNTLFCAVRVTIIQKQEKVEEGFYPGGRPYNRNSFSFVYL